MFGREKGFVENVLENLDLRYSGDVMMIIKDGAKLRSCLVSL